MKIEFDLDKGCAILTNSKGDTFTSKDEELHDFLDGFEAEKSMDSEELKPTDIAGFPIDWKAKTVSVPQAFETDCSSVYKAIKDVAKDLGINIKLTI